LGLKNPIFIPKKTSQVSNYKRNDVKRRKSYSRSNSCEIYKTVNDAPVQEGVENSYRGKFGYLKKNRDFSCYQRRKVKSGIRKGDDDKGQNYPEGSIEVGNGKLLRASLNVFEDRDKKYGKAESYKGN
jgi:hypothetical protein